MSSADAYDRAVTWAHFGSRLATDAVQVTHDPRDLQAGFWAVVMTFEGDLTAIRFADVRIAAPPSDGAWRGLRGAWRSSMNRTAYEAGVHELRQRVAAGTVYQVNLCRVLTHDLAEGASVPALGRLLAERHPAPYAATIHAPEVGVDLACASPEGYLEQRAGRLVSRPIKGTAPSVSEMLPKDYAENVMIVDLVRNDIARVCRPGSVRVDALCRPESHPGLVHLVSDVSGEQVSGVGWGEVLEASFPPGSVSGAPKHTALQAISDLEPVPRGPYCGAIGWVDADRGEARLAVGIRTFWAGREPDGQRVLRFGTGAGITWGSDPAAEWEETRLKARTLTALAGTDLEG